MTESAVTFDLEANAGDMQQAAKDLVEASERLRRLAQEAFDTYNSDAELYVPMLITNAHCDLRQRAEYLAKLEELVEHDELVTLRNDVDEYAGALRYFAGFYGRMYAGRMAANA
jgi:hypothetical protein